jgi:Gram-negative bacterial TonB protein C-terminal
LERKLEVRVDDSPRLVIAFGGNRAYVGDLPEAARELVASGNARVFTGAAMNLVLKVLPLVLTVPIPGFAQDQDLRREAIQLLEHANAVSMSPKLPNLERVDTFRVFDTATGPREGSFTRVVVQGTGRRDEAIFGEYHLVNVWSGEHLATVRTTELAPPEIENVLRLTPIILSRFDDEDVIHAIVDKASGGKKVRCVEFDTIRGEQIGNNEICIDQSNGTLVSEKVGNELIENSEFFPFAGELLPAKITYSFAGVRKLEISQTLTELTEVSENVLAAPPTAEIRDFCKTVRRATAISMPQPKEGHGGRNVDVIVRGIISTDGKVHEAVVQSAEDPDLGNEALALVQQWTFTPCLCDGDPNNQAAQFIVHFRGR